MFGNVPNDYKLVRFLKNIRLVETFGFSLKEVNGLNNSDRKLFDWYVYCKDRKMKMNSGV
jgi:hypothetical protein